MDKVNDLLVLLKSTSAKLQTEATTMFDTLSECAGVTETLTTLEANIRGQIEPLETRRAELIEAVRGLSDSVERLKQEHEDTERGHRQRLADMEMAIRQAEDRLTSIRSVASTLTELMARA